MHILFWKVSLFYHIPEPESITPAIKIGFEECGMRQKQNPAGAGFAGEGGPNRSRTGVPWLRT
ncbi:MAG TPA: hypothetical protein PLA19_05805, partial [Candidatus Pacearchaeota archaeon]|nr:hypothetical protein [Candidatus Pacearchaeota archaeon]